MFTILISVNSHHSVCERKTLFVKAQDYYCKKSFINMDSLGEGG